MSLGAFVVTYRRPDHLRETIRVLFAQSRPPDLVLVVDNANSEETRNLAMGWVGGRVVYEAPGSNLGSAGGTEYGFRRMAAMGFDLIYCGDDDDPPRTSDTLERVVEAIETSGADGSGAVGHRWSWKTGRLDRLKDEELTGIVPVDFIGGGQQMILRKHVVEAGGHPDGRLFFGYPDLEHCLRLQRDGFKLVIDGDLMRRYREFHGRIGLEQRRTVLPKREYARLWRTYYTTRNYIYMMRDEFGRPDLARRQALRAVVRSVASFARGIRYGARSTHFHLLGVWHGYRAKRGPVVSPISKS